MTTSNQMATALLTEHFRYTPLTLLDDIINAVNELVFRAVNAIEDGLNNATPENLGFRPDETIRMSEEARKDALQAAKQTEIDGGIVQLETLLNATVDKDFDKFEIYTLRNILSVGHEEEELAGWVQLDHYRNLDLSQENAPTPEEVQLQRRKLQETVKLSNMLKAEEARNSAVLSKLQSLIGATNKQGDSSASPFAFISSMQQSQKNTTNQHLNQNVQYAISQLPALRTQLSNLKESLQTIPNARYAPEEKDSIAARRRQYVESQSRRAMQRKGVDPENAATVTAASGRKIGRDEVEGIEAVVQALGGAAPVSRSEDDMEE